MRFPTAANVGTVAPPDPDHAATVRELTRTHCGDDADLVLAMLGIQEDE